MQVIADEHGIDPTGTERQNPTLMTVVYLRVACGGAYAATGMTFGVSSEKQGYMSS